MSEQKRTEIGDLGEFGLIDRIAARTTNYHQDTVMGIGDDAAVLEKDESHYTLMSSDMLVEGIHFDLSYAPLQHLGYKAVAVNVSDIAAMNGIPKQVTINLGLTNRFSVEAVEAIYEGINAAARDYKLDVVGGDTTNSRSGLILSVAILGEVTKSNITYRKGAHDTDIICVTGDLGAAYVGLHVLEREKQEFLENPDMQPQLNNYQYIVSRQLRPKARMDIVHELASLGIKPTSMIDTSDGLTSDLFHLCRQSDLGASI
ncbi:MAG: thiamine-phosphate kinase, partial [Cyclobacteriaceae bacterium]|nr:thiamine-phosphate kinase [Cyclobacteriaceae bacterium HetDA_MAG_MS6]